MKNELYRGLSQTELKARCDESCKRLLSNKEIIARVLKFTVDEFSELDINYIRDFCIERKQIYHMPKELTGEQDGLSAEMITGRDSESTIGGEGAFRYDVVFSNHLTAKAKAQILNEEFGIPMESIEQEVEGMCNISEFYYETGLNDGISQGISQGEINATIQMGHDYGIAKDEIINRIVWKYAMAREEAAERVEKMWGRAQEA